MCGIHYFLLLLTALSLSCKTVPDSKQVQSKNNDASEQGVQEDTGNDEEISNSAGVNAGRTDEDGSTSGDSSGPGLGLPGDPCTEEGARACSGHASELRLICRNNRWEQEEPCKENETCSTKIKGAPECVCQAGFARNGSGVCLGVDVCETDNGGCDPLVECDYSEGPAVSEDF